MSNNKTVIIINFVKVPDIATNNKSVLQKQRVIDYYC